jgi:hypothetical protein
MNLMATGQILDVYGFDQKDDPEAVFENQCYKPICAYMELTGFDFETANKELLAFYSLEDAVAIMRHGADWADSQYDDDDDDDGFASAHDGRYCECLQCTGEVTR